MEVGYNSTQTCCFAVLNTGLLQTPKNSKNSDLIFALSPGFCFWDAALQKSFPTLTKSTGSRCRARSEKLGGWAPPLMAVSIPSTIFEDFFDFGRVFGKYFPIKGISPICGEKLFCLARSRSFAECPQLVLSIHRVCSDRI